MKALLEACYHGHSTLTWEDEKYEILELAPDMVFADFPGELINMDNVVKQVSSKKTWKHIFTTFS
jgi:hypothetical protein